MVVGRHPVPSRFLYPILLVAISAALIPVGLCYTFAEHSICKGWTDQGSPIVADKFLLTDKTVYLYTKIRWTDVQEFERLWTTIPSMMRGLSSAGSIEGSFLDMKGFKITLKDPSGVEATLPSPRKMYKVTCDPPGCISAGFWRLLNITETTKNGRWKVNWYEGDRLVFADEFVVGEETAPQQGGPSEPSFLERYGLLIGVGSALVIVGIMAVVYILKVRKRPVEVPAPPFTLPPPAPT